MSLEFDEQLGKLNDALAEAEWKALDSLARYKFMMFGYWAAMWVHLNRLHPYETRKNPFKTLVSQARMMKKLKSKGNP